MAEVGIVVKHEPSEGGVIKQVWGALAERHGIPFWTQPHEGAINLYTHGRSHFEHPVHEYGVYIGHGIADKGNWRHHAPRFDALVVPHAYLAWKLPNTGRPVLVGGVPMFHDLEERQPLSKRVLIATTINPFKDKPGYRYASEDGLGDTIASVLAQHGWSATVSEHPSKNLGLATPLDAYLDAEIVVADPGSPAIIATALGRPVIRTPGTRALRGTFEYTLENDWYTPGTVAQIPGLAARQHRTISPRRRRYAGWPREWMWGSVLDNLLAFAEKKGVH